MLSVHGQYACIVLRRWGLVLHHGSACAWFSAGRRGPCVPCVSGPVWPGNCVRRLRSGTTSDSQLATHHAFPYVWGICAAALGLILHHGCACTRLLVGRRGPCVFICSSPTVSLQRWRFTSRRNVALGPTLAQCTLCIAACVVAHLQVPECRTARKLCVDGPAPPPTDPMHCKVTVTRYTSRSNVDLGPTLAHSCPWIVRMYLAAA